MKKVILESPYAGGTQKNVEYARKCMRDCIARSEAPFASHLLYTQCLDDNDEKERTIGMIAGFEWREVADYTVVYTDLGISGGMKAGIEHAKKIGHEIKYRKLKKITT